MQVVVVVLNGVYPQGEVDPQVEGFGRLQGFVFGEGRGVFEVGAKADTGIGEESAVHLLGNELLLLVGRGKGLTDDAGIAEQVGVDADEFGFGDPARAARASCLTREASISTVSPSSPANTPAFQSC